MKLDSTYRKPELWGGIECTINRVQEHYRDQLNASGHYTREGDIEAIAKLGIKKIRYPVLWEKHEPIEGNPVNFDWVSAQLASIRDNGMEPIVGLLHHGSGPAFTDLEDVNFPRRLASYAEKVAKKFPWIRYYTPVNEPLTTARFSGLYGHWYPHKKNSKAFLRMLVNQVKGIVLSMQAIRKINPAAMLVQTEDLACIHSTKKLSYQADYENHRRWLSYDLLCGKVNTRHFFWKELLNAGIKAEELHFLRENPCPPDIAGFNYYVTSERWLDDEIERYDPSLRGGNGRHQYVDTEAVRKCDPHGLGALLTEAWNRYHLPMAITECHLGCTREEQMRWFDEAWRTANELNKKRIPVKAVTAWSLLGAHDWCTLLTCDLQSYETGVFDIRGEQLRPTALAKQILATATDNRYDHPLLSTKGWWSRKAIDLAAPVILVIGATGTLGSAFLRICEQRGINAKGLTRNEINILSVSDIDRVIEKYKPWAIINCAGFVRVDDAELCPDECFSINTVAPELLAGSCNKYGIRFMTFSSDLVFAGEKLSPYKEDDQTGPLNIYGRSKALAEEKVAASGCSSLIIRTSAFFGPWDKYNFAWSVIETCKNNNAFHAVSDVIVSPTYVPDLVNISLDLFIDEEEGIWHIANDGSLSWSDFAKEVAGRSGIREPVFRDMSLFEMDWRAPRPQYSALVNNRGIKLPSLGNAIERFCKEKMI